MKLTEQELHLVQQGRRRLEHTRINAEATVQAATAAFEGMLRDMAELRGVTGPFHLADDGTITEQSDDQDGIKDQLSALLQGG